MNPSHIAVGWAVSLALLFGLAASHSLSANGVAQLVEKGISAYQNKSYTAAERQFAAALKRDPTSARIAFDLGTAELRLGHNKKALTYLKQAASSQEASDSLKANAIYNRAEAFAAMGEAAWKLASASKGSAGASTETALRAYERSASAFYRVLQLAPSRSDAAYNLEVVRSRIARLERLEPAAKRGSAARGPAS